MERDSKSVVLEGPKNIRNEDIFENGRIIVVKMPQFGSWIFVFQLKNCSENYATTIVCVRCFHIVLFIGFYSDHYFKRVFCF